MSSTIGKSLRLFALAINNFLVFQVGFAQTDVKQQLKLEVIDTAIFFKGSTHDSISFKCSNLTNHNLLLYGKNTEFRKYVDLEDICNEKRTGGGFAIFLYDDNFEIRYAEWHLDPTNDRTVTKELVDSVVNEDSKRFREGKILVRSNESVCLRKLFNIGDYHLMKGIYYLEIAYYAGKGMERILVGEEQIYNDLTQFQAELFLGCSVSNRVKLIID